MKIETELLLQEFREEQSDLFDSNGIAYSMLSHKEPMTRILVLINAMNDELNQRTVIFKDGTFIKTESDLEAAEYENNPDWLVSV